jgi:hypothetical protein
VADGFCLGANGNGKSSKPTTGGLDRLAPDANSSQVTFTKDVAPIVQQHCQTCHRAGEGTPFSLLTYEQARPWARAMKSMVQQREMPPWFEDGHTERFKNNRSLTQAEIDTIVAWADAGAPKGDGKDLSPPLQFVQGWSIPKPDVIFQLPKPFPIPDSGILEYQYVILPTGFHRRQVGSVCRSGADGSLCRASHCCVCAPPGVKLLQGPTQGCVLLGSASQDRQESGSG